MKPSIEAREEYERKHGFTMSACKSWISENEVFGAVTDQDVIDAFTIYRLSRVRERKLLSGICKKISCQCDIEEPNVALMFAVFEAAARDLLLEFGFYQRDAVRYFRGPMPHLQVIGIDPDWVRTLFKQAGLDGLYRVESAQ